MRPSGTRENKQTNKQTTRWCLLRAGRSVCSATNSRMLFTKDGVVGQICTLHLLKLNLLLILYLKVWNKIVHKSWKSKIKLFQCLGLVNFAFLRIWPKISYLLQVIIDQPPSLVAWCFCGVIIWPWPPWGVSSLTWGKWGQLVPTFQGRFKLE
jgi:hypothetical protein